MARLEGASSPRRPLSGDAACPMDQAATNEVARMRGDPGACEFDDYVCASMMRELYNKHAGWLLLIVAVVLFGIVTPTALLIWQAFTPLAAVQRSELGTFVSATANPGGVFSPTYTSIQTTVGTVTVEGAISAARGQKLSIETLNKIGMQLCVDDDLRTCMPLVSPWLGTLEPTPQAASITDFQRVGLSTDNLKGWLELGVMLCIMVFIVAIEFNGFADDDMGNTAAANSGSS